MSLKTALATILEDTTALTALVGTRIYSVMLPQGFTLPAVVFRMTADETERILSGHAGKARTTFEVSYCAVTDTAAETGGEIIRIALDGYSGTVSSVKIQSVIMTTRSDDYEPDLNIFRRVMEFKIGHIEATT
jgi:hypothetical protein